MCVPACQHASMPAPCPILIPCLPSPAQPHLPAFLCLCLYFSACFCFFDEGCCHWQLMQSPFRPLLSLSVRAWCVCPGCPPRLLADQAQPDPDPQLPPTSPSMLLSVATLAQHPDGLTAVPLGSVYPLGQPSDNTGGTQLVDPPGMHSTCVFMCVSACASSSKRVATCTFVCASGVLPFPLGPSHAFT